MAKLIKSHKGYKIKETTSKDNTTFKYWIIDPEFSTTEPIHECDNLQECYDFIE